MCTREDKLAHYLGTSYLDDVMSQNELTVAWAYLQVDTQVPKMFGIQIPTAMVMVKKLFQTG